METLRWQHRWAKHFKAWQRLYEKGGDPPRQFFERPEVAPHLVLFLSVFSELSTERQIGMSLGPIPRSKIKEYLVEELELSGSGYEHAYAVLRRVDDEYLSMMNGSSDGKTKDGETKVDSTDTAGVKQIFRNIGEKQKNAKPAAKKKTPT